MNSKIEERRMMTQLNKDARRDRMLGEYKDRVETRDLDSEFMRAFYAEMSVFSETVVTIENAAVLCNQYRDMIQRYVVRRLASHKDLHANVNVFSESVNVDQKPIFVVRICINNDNDTTWQCSSLSLFISGRQVIEEFNGFCSNPLFDANFSTKLNILLQKNEIVIKRKYKYVKPHGDGYNVMYECRCNFTYDDVAYSFEEDAMQYKLYARFKCDQAIFAMFTEAGFE